jgi:hypothetical protein
MKKILQSLSAIIALSISGVNAQDGIEIRLDGAGADISGGMHSINLYPGSPDFDGSLYIVHFVVTNNTGSDKQWRITRQKINVPGTWVDQICWPPLCFNASGNTYTTPNSGSYPAPTIVDGTSTTTNAEVAELKPQITPDQSAASYALYRYYITDAATGNYMDSVDLAINFVLATPTIKQAPIINVSPNPANDIVNISTGSLENSSIKILDVLGKSIYTETNASGMKTVDVSNFKNGVYFVMIEAPGMKTITRKLIVKH